MKTGKRSKSMPRLRRDRDNVRTKKWSTHDSDDFFVKKQEEQECRLTEKKQMP